MGCLLSLARLDSSLDRYYLSMSQKQNLSLLIEIIDWTSAYPADRLQLSPKVPAAMHAVDERDLQAVAEGSILLDREPQSYSARVRHTLRHRTNHGSRSGHKLGK